MCERVHNTLRLQPNLTLELEKERQLLELAQGKHGDSARILNRLLEVYIELNDAEYIDRVLSRLQSLTEDEPALIVNLAKAWLALDRPQQAIDAIARAPAVISKEPGIQMILAEGFYRQQRYRKCRELLESLIHANDIQPDVQDLYLRVLQATGAGSDELIACSRKILVQQPTNVRARACLMDTGLDSATEPLDIKPLVRTYMVDGDESLDDLAGFTERLNDLIADGDDWVDEVADYATRNGKQRELFLSEGLSKIGRDTQLQFIEFINSCLGHYLSEVAAVGEGYLDTESSLFQIRLWSVVLFAGGYQMPHVHPGGWMSGVYYAKVPSSDGDEGAIEFGAQNAAGDFVSLRKIQPLPGMLVLFPSFVRHRTVPTIGPDARISVSMDIVPT